MRQGAKLFSCVISFKGEKENQAKIRQEKCYMEFSQDSILAKQMTI